MCAPKKNDVGKYAEGDRASEDHTIREVLSDEATHETWWKGRG